MFYEIGTVETLVEITEKESTISLKATKRKLKLEILDYRPFT